jgi:hypothetical protein
MAGKVVTITPVDGEPVARLEGDTLVLTNFRERDTQVVALVNDAENAEAVVHDCLSVGARALSAAHATTEVAVVEKAFDEMTNTFTQGLEQFTGELDAKTKELLDGEDGALPRSLEEFKDEIEQLLDGTFDPTSKVSALAKLEEVMRKQAIEQVKAIRVLIDPDNNESPLARYHRQVIKSVEKETARVQKAVEELKTQLAVGEAKAEMFELTTKKGFTFEDALEAALITVCGPHGDIAERVGGTPGARGKKGDFKVALNPDDTAGQDVCYALEAKNATYKLRDILKELDRGIANRGALAGIAVFAKPEQCPGDSPLQTYGNRALVVYDPDVENDLALRLACAWARWIARRQVAGDGETIDLDRIGGLIDRARQALRTQTTGRGQPASPGPASLRERPPAALSTGWGLNQRNDVERIAEPYTDISVGRAGISARSTYSLCGPAILEVHGDE